MNLVHHTKKQPKTMPLSHLFIFLPSSFFLSFFLCLFVCLFVSLFVCLFLSLFVLVLVVVVVVVDHPSPHTKAASVVLFVSIWLQVERGREDNATLQPRSALVQLPRLKNDGIWNPGRESNHLDVPGS